MKLEANTRLVTTGDSITDCGRNRPVGERKGIGEGYVSIVDAALMTCYADRKIRVLNTGISGNTIRDIAGRWQTDVVDLQPDWVSMMIGINDVWRQFDCPQQPEKHVLLDEYTETYDRLISGIRPQLKGLILMTPYFIEPNPEEPMRKLMDQYSAVVKSMAEKYDGIFVDVQAAFNEVLEKAHPLALAADRVHPNKAGHMIIARAFLKGIEFDW